jgi:uncharacterized protein YigA (DUF484 family)
VRLVLHRPVEGLPPVDWLQIIDAEDLALLPFRGFMAKGDPLCGRLQVEKLALLFAGEAEQVQSAALIALPGLGLLAIGSSDPQHYKSSLGTLFLGYIAEVLARVVPGFATPLRSVR